MGLMLGFGADFVAAQVHSAQERDQLIDAATAQRELLTTRVALAEEALKRARALFFQGLVSRDVLLAAEDEVRGVQSQRERLDLDIIETRATAARPRDELWAPLVGGRDFVSDRLKIEAAARQRALTVAEQRQRDAQRLLRLGLVAPSVEATTVAGVRDAERQLALIAKQLELRRRFFAEQLTSEAVTRDDQRLVVEADVDRTLAELSLALDRAALAQARLKIGDTSELETLRAKLDALELSATLDKLRTQLREMERDRKK